MNVWGQKWYVTEHQADEMKKQEAYTSFRFEDENGNAFIYWTFSSSDFRIVSNSGVFNYNERRFVPITVGFYDKDNKLLEKSEITLKVEEDAQIARVPYKKKTATKALKYINENEGYIRIIAPLYGRIADFEIKVLCKKSCEE